MIPISMEVYFDDFKVTHTKSPVVQQDEYYPFGTRVVYHNGAELFRTNQRGRITGGQINRALKAKRKEEENAQH